MVSGHASHDQVQLPCMLGWLGIHGPRGILILRDMVEEAYYVHIALDHMPQAAGDGLGWYGHVRHELNGLALSSSML